VAVADFTEKKDAGLCHRFALNPLALSRRNFSFPRMAFSQKQE